MVDMEKPAVVVSCDSHVGPKLVEQLRPYCPQQYLEQFDEDVAAQAQQSGALASMAARGRHPNIDRDGHFDAPARLRDMDDDGVAAELIWHFSQNGENLPWIGQGLGTVFKHQFELGAVAYDIYNRWLADFCSEDPERLLGLVYIPSWDIDASIKTLEWAREAGLRCLNFPAPSRPGVKEYNDPAWDPFWSACTDLGFALSTHSSGGPFFDFTRGPGGMQIIAYEGGSWLARRGVWILTYGEVFQRHPDLKLVITEQVEGWFVPTMHELDSFYLTFGLSGGLEKMPSEYVRENVFLGASFISQWQAQDAVEHDYVDNVLWGRDYPHVEGAFQATREPDEEPMTKLSLRHVLSGIPSADALKIVGGNAIRVFGLDEAYLAEVAARIDAPTPARARGRARSRDAAAERRQRLHRPVRPAPAGARALRTR